MNISPIDHASSIDIAVYRLLMAIHQLDILKEQHRYVHAPHVEDLQRIIRYSRE